MFSPQPIYLRVMLQSDRGIVKCCECMSCALCACAARMTPQRLPRLPTDPDLFTKKLKNIEYSSSDPDKLLSDDQRLKRTRTGSLNENTSKIPFVEITSADFTSYDGIFSNDIDTTLLSPKKFLDPYTPESVESHSPNAEVSNDSDELTEIIDVLRPIDKSKLKRDRSVSPTQLKSRLDMLLSGKDRKEKNRISDKKVPELQRLNSQESCKSDGSKKSGLCCFALKCYGFCRRRARTVNCDCSGLKCCTS